MSARYKTQAAGNLENATNRLAENFSNPGGRKFGKCNKQAGGKLVKARRQEIWKNEKYSSLKFHTKDRWEKIWGNVAIDLNS